MQRGKALAQGGDDTHTREAPMRPLTLGSLLALCVTAPTLAQDSPYYQGQTVTIELESITSIPSRRAVAS